jgi:DNA mismatch repair protein MutS
MPATPMMQQYHEARAAAGDALLLFRMGDFYELFFEDARTAARVLGLALTSRDKGDDPVPMAGFPHHQLDAYLAKIIAAGHRAAICEQVEDPKLAKGLVRREVTRIVTPGTLTDDSLLNPQASNFLAAVAQSSRKQPDGTETLVGLAWVDLSTGRFFAAAISAGQVADHLARIQPSELLLHDDAPLFPHESADGIAITRRPAWSFGHSAAIEALAKQFGTHSLDGFGFGCEPDSPDASALRAAGGILDYLTETQKVSLAHIDRLAPYSTSDCLAIDPATRRSLELNCTVRDGRREGSLLGVIDRTVTSPGSRLLADWLAAPPTNVGMINVRLDAVGELVDDATLTANLREVLKQTYDIQRLLSRTTTGRASPRDLAFVGRTLALLPKIKARLTGRASVLLHEVEARIDLCGDVRGPLEQALVEECPLVAREGGFVRPGYRADLDELRALSAGGKQWMASYQAAECQRTGIANIKIGFNQVFGYYLEVTHTHRDKIPADYIRKQTLKNAERYITPELKDYEEKVLTAEDRAREIEYDVFCQLRSLIAAAAARIQQTANALAEIDVLASLAELARSRNYVRPTITAEPILDIEAGRHPVLDLTEPEGTFVPNSVWCGARGLGLGAAEKLAAGESQVPSPQSPTPSLLLITGPNMSGKSTYIRQAALLTLLAQMGSFVPARRATIGIADRIFARIGASDELSRGQSTFMVEMTETARILNTATPRSLVILDEIGRGTSTYDGLSLAWSVVEHLHNAIDCRTLFATHYHELTDLESELPGMRNYNVAVKEWDDKVVFLHEIVPGAADKSYGIHVAQLAGVPTSVSERAKEVLAMLEQQHETHPRAAIRQGDNAVIASRNGHESANGWQMTLFSTEEHPLLEEIRATDLDGTSPRDAYELLREWQSCLLPTTADSRTSTR